MRTRVFAGARAPELHLLPVAIEPDATKTSRNVLLASCASNVVFMLHEKEGDDRLPARFLLLTSTILRPEWSGIGESDAGCGVCVQ